MADRVTMEAELDALAARRELLSRHAPERNQISGRMLALRIALRQQARMDRWAGVLKNRADDADQMDDGLTLLSRMT